MTQYYKELLHKLNNPPALKKEHHLFLLGTGVKYVERPTVPNNSNKESKYYVRGETFSYTAQLMTQLLGEKATTAPDAHESSSENYAHSYHSDSVDVINGADDPGREVGDRVAKALMLALGAIAEGKTNLSVSGFSRGGVEAIVLTHELARIRDALQNDALKPASQRKALAAIIIESNTVPALTINPWAHPSSTRAYLDGLVSKEAQPNEDELKAALLKNLEQLQVNLFVLDPVPGGNRAKVIRIGWQEEAFYTLPEFVVKRHEFVQKHETSNCFKPIIPLGMPYEVIPGCHGTGDGNQYDHNSEPVPDEYIKPGTDIKIDLSNKKDLSGVQDLVLRRWLDFTFPDAIALEQKFDFGHRELDAVTNSYLPADRAARNIALNQNYEAINKNYEGFQLLAFRNYNGLGRHMEHRQVHLHKRGSTPITELDVHGDGKSFVNLQHVQLWMSNQLNGADFFGKSLVGQVEWIKNNIEEAFSTKKLPKSVAPDAYMIKQLLKTASNHGLVKESLSYLINTVAQTYLRNHLSLEERTQCRSCVENTFNTLANAASVPSTKNPALKELAQSLTTIVQTDLTNTMIIHQYSLLALANKLASDESAVLANFGKVADAQDDTVDSPMSWLISTQKLVAELDLLKEQIGALETWCDKEMLTNDWKAMLPKFGVNPEDGSYEAYKGRLFQYIEQQRMLLMAGASKILAKMPEALDKKPEGMEQRFYETIHKFASIDKVNKQLHTTAEQLDSMTKKLELQLVAQQQTIAELTIQNQSLVEQLSEKDTQLKNSDNLHTLKTEMLLDAGGRLSNLAEEIKTLKLQLEAQQQEIQKQTSLNQSLEQQLHEKEILLESAQQLATNATNSLTKAELSNKGLEQQLQNSESTSKKGNDELVKVRAEVVRLQSEVEGLKRQSTVITDDLNNERIALQKTDRTIETLNDTIRVSNEALKTAQEELILLKQELAVKNAVPLETIKPPVTDNSADASNQTMKKQLQAYQSTKERASIVTIDRLLQVTTNYLTHLIESDDQSPLAEAKMASVYELLGHLHNTELLPSEQLTAFDNSLKSTQDTIKEHRDPTWMRFFRDCARILTIAASGLGLYRIASGQSPQFFRPSKGEQLIEEVNNINPPSAK